MEAAPPPSDESTRSNPGLHLGVFHRRDASSAIESINDLKPASAEAHQLSDVKRWKAGSAHKTLTRACSIWVFWDGERRQAWRPAVALTASTAVRGGGRLGGTEGRCDKSRKESGVAATVLTVPWGYCFPPPKKKKKLITLLGLSDSLPEGFYSFYNLEPMGGVSASYFFSITVPKHSWFDVQELSLSKGYELCPTFLCGPHRA